MQPQSSLYESYRFRATRGVIRLHTDSRIGGLVNNTLNLMCAEF